MRERWFGATGRRVPEIAVEGELDVGEALVLDDVSDERALHEAHATGQPIVVRAASAEAVKSAIGKLIAAETDILSDDDLVDLLKIQGYDVARRTVAKYREAMGIGSSIQRRRTRKIAGA